MTTDWKLLFSVKDKDEGIILEKYTNTKLFSRLLNITTKGITISKEAFKYVPDITDWLDNYLVNKDNYECMDDYLNDYYHLTDDIINDINKKIHPIGYRKEI